MSRKSLAWGLGALLLGAGVGRAARADAPAGTPPPPSAVQQDIHKVENQVDKSVREGRAAVSDASITAKLKTEMWKDGMLRANDIHVETNNGVITLGGTVRTESERARALDLAKSMYGANGVEDEMRVRMPGDEASKK
jgi:hyperosmotically inducible protein